MSKGSILVVEDEIIIATDLSDRLQALGYRVPRICSAGEEAIQAAGEVCPDLVLMDIRLEGPLDGVEAAEQIRRLYDLPVIFVSAHADTATLTRAKHSEPYGYILKPFDEQLLSIQLELALYKHKTGRELRQQREWLRIILTSIGDAVLATDAAGQVTFINPAASNLSGWDASEVQGKPASEVFSIIHEQTGEPLEHLATRVLRDKQPIVLSNHTALRTRDGRIVPVEDSAAPMLDREDQVIGSVLVFRDVTDRRRAAEALNNSLRDLRAAQDELVRSARLAVLGQLAGGVAHELRTPLSVIRNSVYFLFHGKNADDTERREAHDEVTRAIASCDHIIGEMLDFVREPTGESSDFPLGEAIQRALRALSLPSSVRLVHSESKDALRVRANEEHVTRILTNLILNAVQAMPQGGELSIGVSENPGNKVCVAIHDTGCGIPAENLAKIFDPLFTTKARGIGLGLAVCRRYAQLSAGALSVESEVGQGSTFRLELMAAQT